MQRKVISILIEVYITEYLLSDMIDMETNLRT